MLTLNSFDYHLPEDLIAQYPAGKRRLSRLLVLDRRRRTIEHKNFTDFISYLSGKDTLALNNTYVIP
ncbi:MAG: S-adenosylmethionine:tRNA ribosyltransferase-isomerase, partial [Candidatus Omnitrophica bacterium]|nr:S-adenosylmethionine:tRNA ribosyltransferase-isomerase [Candidatus Omnitrophota bacterium]